MKIIASLFSHIFFLTPKVAKEKDVFFLVFRFGNHSYMPGIKKGCRPGSNMQQIMVADQFLTCKKKMYKKEEYTIMRI